MNKFNLIHKCRSANCTFFSAVILVFLLTPLALTLVLIIPNSSASAQSTAVENTDAVEPPLTEPQQRIAEGTLEGESPTQAKGLRSRSEILTAPSGRSTEPRGSTVITAPGQDNDAPSEHNNPEVIKAPSGSAEQPPSGVIRSVDDVAGLSE